MNNALSWDSGLIKKYDLSGPRYTSYPTAVQFSEAFNAHHYETSAWQSATAGTPLSLYIHVPFCNHACYYCACNKIVTKDQSKASLYLDYLFREIEMQAQLFDQRQPVQQLHFDGGTPTLLNSDQITALMNKLAEHFQLEQGEQVDYSIELDPREVDWAMMGTLRDLDFNRISIGVQDLNQKVQKAVNRVQSEQKIQSLVDAAHAMAFKSIHMDLIYGLPHQTTGSFLETVDRVITMTPDRLSLFNYAHLPRRFMPQHRIASQDLPSSAQKLDILQQATEKLLEQGYVYIGMDHFALPDDELAVAQETGALHRNFQGYTTHNHCDLLAIGVSSISKVGSVYAQNHTSMEQYQSAIDSGQLPIYRGLVMTEDDQVRQAVINELICHFRLVPSQIGKRFGIDFTDYFRSELGALAPMEKDGLISVSNETIEVLPKGKLLIRNICMQFDPYLQQQTEQQLYSRVI